MASTTERDTLNRLIETCRDGGRGFRLAADHLGTAELRELFAGMALQREQFAAELEPYAQRLGGGHASDGTTAAALHRGWMTVKDAMMNYDEAAIVGEAVRGDTAAANTYADALLGLLPPDAREVIARQYAAILGVQRQLDALAFSKAADE